MIILQIILTLYKKNSTKPLSWFCTKYARDFFSGKNVKIFAYLCLNIRISESTHLAFLTMRMFEYEPGGLASWFNCRPASYLRLITLLFRDSSVVSRSSLFFYNSYKAVSNWLVAIWRINIDFSSFKSIEIHLNFLQISVCELNINNLFDNYCKNWKSHFFHFMCCCVLI